MSDLHTRVGGAWKKVDKLHVRVGGAWKAVKKGYVRVGGAWKEFFSALSVFLTASSTLSTTAPDPGPVVLTLNVLRDGTFTRSGGGTTSGTVSGWADPPSATVGDDFTVRLTVNSGDSPTSGSATGSILALTSDRSWTWNTTSPVGLSANVTLEIFAASGGSALASATFDVQVSTTI
jgi:hypothetical protein